MNKFDDIAARFPGAGTLVKGIQILDLISRSAEPCSSSVLLRETGLPKATLYRLLAALVEFGYVRHDKQAKTYGLGPHLIELARSSLGEFDLRSAASHELQRLSAQLNETVSLSVLEEERVIYVDVHRPSNPIAVGVEVGRNLPAIESASGVAIFAALPPHEVQSFLDGHDDDARHAFLADIAMSRSRGYTIAPSRTIPGVVVIAVPVMGPPGFGRGALVVSALESAFTQEKRHVVGRDLMEAARRIMGNIGTAPVSISPNPRPSRHIDEALRCVQPAGAIVGEGPLWDERNALIRWVDVAAPAIHQFDPVGARTAKTAAKQLISAVLPASDGGLIAVTQNGLQSFDPVSAALSPIHDPEAHLPGNRFNDAKTDRLGRVWAGTMSLDAAMPSGALYCFDTPTSARAVDGGFQVSNGLGWSPDDRVFYFTDSGLGTVFAYDFDLARGTVSNRRVFAQFEASEGKPDGLSVDAEGNVWIALWDGWRVAGYAPDGRLIRSIDMPVPRPASCCFGGEDLRTMYITSASIRLPANVLDDAPLSGGLFAIGMDVPGQPTTEVQV
ncbi:hypothetical protein ACMU_18475 [Actibacterium mucosum KCTC 23349]|uniref:IclR family transcriptional regulator n=1 Tax=Actibacterium mucosum KCTC 23349 TaxID=1454373 RepID=A0A037ZD86_9RHOB|nr:SMP-30/gluconolactonase/LRE family protein [Actibacterium mucosum]KAJ54414.1 hypothetical protein ACMU_18475 [Actibacterium mucosum KCTC 23349]